MKTQEVINYMRHEWHQAMLGISEQWHHLRQRSNHAIVPFNHGEMPDDEVEWGLIAIDMYETEDRLIIQVEVPGLDSDSVEVKVEESSLIITGNKPLPQDISGKGRYFNHEIAYGAFERKISLPHLRIDEENNSASCSNGVLTIALPLLSASHPPPRSISVH